MSEMSISELSIALIGGCLLGICFFSSLKLTVRHFYKVRRPTLLIISSFLFRIMMVLISAYFLVTQISLQALLIALASFMFVRVVFTRAEITKVSQ